MLNTSVFTHPSDYNRVRAAFEVAGIKPRHDYSNFCGDQWMGDTGKIKEVLVSIGVQFKTL
jgi:hypothetical protein